MTGIFDSGKGGLAALCELRRLCPLENIIFLADRENAPYGPKSAEQIESIVKANVKKLICLGAERVLMACCTASTVFDRLPTELKDKCIEIIRPSAAEAVKRSLGTVGVISTEATYKSLTFPRAITGFNPKLAVVSAYSAEMVELVEGGCRDGEVGVTEEKIIRNALAPILDSRADVLILGCTHFTHLREKIEEIAGIPTVSPAFVGAELAATKICGKEEGKTVFV